MKSFLRLTDYDKSDLLRIFRIADELQEGKYQDFLKGKTVVMFFPGSSIRTRVTFEKGIYLLGGQTILFPPEALDKKEEICDVMGYLNSWADLIVVRHKEIGLLEQMAHYGKMPVINAMTDVNHPCEVLTDLYSLSKRRKNFERDHYLFCGRKGNIGLAWKEAAQAMGLAFSQCCPVGYEMEGVRVFHDLKQAAVGADIICTDSLPGELLAEFRDYQVTEEIMNMANQGAALNPCPPFFRGEEVSAEAIDSPYFVGYEFKKYLLDIQQAVMIGLLQEE